MADAEQLCARLPKRSDVVYSGLVLNMRGLERAHAAGLGTIDVSVAASETLSRKNVRYSVEEGMERMAAMVARAREYGHEGASGGANRLRMCL